MFKKGDKVLISCGNADSKVTMDAIIESERPLVAAIKGSASALCSGKQSVVSLSNPAQPEVVMSAMVDGAKGNSLTLKPLGSREMRQFVRVSAWVELSHEVAQEGDEEVDLDAFSQPELGKPLPEMSAFQMKQLAETEEASEAVLYLIKAVQALDRKLESLAALTKDLIDRTYKVQMIRRRVNISGSGIYFLSESGYEPGALLNLRLRLPKRGSNEIFAQVEVVRADVRPDAHGDGGDLSYGVACKYSRIREADREQIISFTVQKQRETLRRLRAKEDFKLDS